MDARTQDLVSPAAEPAPVRSGVVRFAPPSMRPLMTFIHRWVGLIMAAFLFVSGVTGAVISWDHELDDVLNPHLMFAQSSQAGSKVGSSRVDLQACKLEYSIVSPK